MFFFHSFDAKNVLIFCAINFKYNFSNLQQQKFLNITNQNILANAFPETCLDLTPNYGVDASGVYVIHPFGNLTKIPVYCDLHTDGGGWMVSNFTTK